MIRVATRKNQRALIARGREVLKIEADAIRALKIDGRFAAAVELIFGSKGRVLVSGIGKSGHVARKIASTLSSTGTPAYFVHPAEASHGDLGMIEKGDVFVAISYSGTSAELTDIVPLVRRRAKLIAITGRPASALAREADVSLDASVPKEACPHNLAPTASTTAALALGDALALALLDARGFSVEDFARSHPGGALGRRLLTRVRDVMVSGAALPAVGIDATLGQAVVEMSGKGLGMTAIVDAAGKVSGIFTDGDLRRCLDRVRDLAGAKVADVMTRTPRFIGPERLAIDCVEMMETPPKKTVLLVVDQAGHLVGAVHIHDLFRARVV
ncbi:MAG: KpsF/GutQ family sugar-phosphate isomerase [Arenimonas sp.]